MRLIAPDGRGLHVEDSGGDGPPVLCLAGLTRDGRDFAPLAAHLAGRFRVIRLDSRGRGGSDRATDPAAEYTVEVEARDALWLTERLGLTRIGVVGTSRGGILGMAMAAARPGLVAALVLNDIGAEIAPEGLRRIAGRIGRAPDWPDFAAAARALAAENAAEFPGLPPAAWEAFARRTLAEADGRPVLSYDPALAVTIPPLPDDAPPVDLWPLFSAIGETPVLVLRGANSDILTAATLARMRAARPDLEAVTIPDRGHAPFLDEPEAVAAIVRFLTGRLCR
ncbi:MAG: hydrolase [Paracoccaceae bacterium]|nr:MAG: hydrolase [Paracoccaceae bacterium]